VGRSPRRWENSTHLNCRESRKTLPRRLPPVAHHAFARLPGHSGRRFFFRRTVRSPKQTVPVGIPGATAPAVPPPPSQSHAHSRPMGSRRGPDRRRLLAEPRPNTSHTAPRGGQVAAESRPPPPGLAWAWWQSLVRGELCVRAQRGRGRGFQKSPTKSLADGSTGRPALRPTPPSLPPRKSPQPPIWLKRSRSW